MTIALPRLAVDGVAWSIEVKDSNSGAVLLSFDSDRLCQTASIGKVFLLAEVARRLTEGSLSADDRVSAPDELMVADSGILYRMRDQRPTVYDAAVLVGAVSDNLATNALLSLCGLDRVKSVAAELGFQESSLLDFIRDVRTPSQPWASSQGTAGELCELMCRLSRGEVYSPSVSDQVLTWLAADTDTSMVAAAFLSDPLAHVDSDYEGLTLRHKTGTTSVVRADIGVVSSATRSVGYAVLANWASAGADRRADVLATMNDLGRRIRAHLADGHREVW